MARFSTPGVYVKENNAFSSSVVAVPTAVPAFVGYTEKATKGPNSLSLTPTKVNSLKEYITLFGRGPKATYSIKAKGDSFELTPDAKTHYSLYNSLRLYFANGGGGCFIVSVGDYSGNGVNFKDLKEGLDTLVTEQEPSMLAIPDATLLKRDECYTLYQHMLRHCGKDTKNRIAILDVHGGDKERTFDKDDVIAAFRDGIGNNFLNYGAAYYPYMNTNITSSSELNFRNISNSNELIKILTNEAQTRYFGSPLSSGKGSTRATKPAPKGGTSGGAKAAASAKPTATAVAAPEVEDRVMRRYEEVKAEIDRLKTANGSSGVIDQNLRAVSPMYNQILNSMKDSLNVQPTAGIMAGVYAMVDNSVGVHKAPANVSLTAVLSPCVNITAQMQEDLNLPINGKAVNAIRTFVGKGVLVWGARTLDGNSQDWRYINVRRTLIFIEQSVKSAVENYVFEPNTPQTWLKVRVAIENFLNSVWKSGALLGISPAQAFEVVLGLGQTMTPDDILDGVMRISVFVSVARPAEFVEITFEQRMLEGLEEGGEDEEGEEGDEEGGDEGGDEGGE